MSAATVVRYKLHFVWEDEKEEQWLRAMARQGLHLVKANQMCRYVFRVGAPDDVVYRLDYLPRARKDTSYFQLFEDAGWEHAWACSGWQYWRKPAQGGEPEIFTDRQSKVEKLRRVRQIMAGVGVISTAGIWANPAYWRFGDLHISLASRVGVSAIAVAVLGIWVYAFCKLTQRIRAVSSGAA